jgi:hypothetical protein
VLIHARLAGIPVIGYSEMFLDLDMSTTNPVTQVQVFPLVHISVLGYIMYVFRGGWFDLPIVLWDFYVFRAFIRSIRGHKTLRCSRQARQGGGGQGTLEMSNAFNSRHVPKLALAPSRGRSRSRDGA